MAIHQEKKKNYKHQFVLLIVVIDQLLGKIINIILANKYSQFSLLS